MLLLYPGELYRLLGASSYVDNTTNEMAAMRILIYKLLSENETNAFFSENSTLLKPKLYRNYHLNEI